MSWADDMDRAGIGYDRDTNGNRVTPPDAHMFTHRRIEEEGEVVCAACNQIWPCASAEPTEAHP